MLIPYLLAFHNLLMIDTYITLSYRLSYHYCIYVQCFYFNTTSIYYIENAIVQIGLVHVNIIQKDNHIICKRRFITCYENPLFWEVELKATANLWQGVSETFMTVCSIFKISYWIIITRYIYIYIYVYDFYIIFCSTHKQTTPIEVSVLLITIIKYDIII